MSNTLDNNVFKVWIVDSDENFVHTNTLVHLIINWKETTVWHREYITWDFQLPSNRFEEQYMFRNFRDTSSYPNARWPNEFIDSMLEAVNEGNVWKSFEFVIENLKAANPIMFNTARWNSSQTIARAIEQVCINIFSPEEKTEHLKNIREKYKLWSKYSDSAVFHIYFNNILFHIWINDPYFLSTNNLEPLNNAHNKTYAFDLQLEHIRKIWRILHQDSKFDWVLRTWFSDDSIRNIISMIDYIGLNTKRLNIDPSVFYTGNQDEIFRKETISGKRWKTITTAKWKMLKIKL